MVTVSSVNGILIIFRTPLQKYLSYEYESLK